MNYRNQYTTNQYQKPVKKSPRFLASHVRTGNYGENYIKQLLRDSGYLAKKTRKKRFAGDLWTLSTQTNVTTRIEVKTANEGQSGTYCFCLNKEGHTSCNYSDFTILLCIDKYNNHYVYCIPCYLMTAQSIRITSHPTKYAGKYAAFRVRESINFEHTLQVGVLWQ